MTISKSRQEIIRLVRARVEEMSFTYSGEVLAGVKAFYKHYEVCALLDEIDELKFELQKRRPSTSLIVDTKAIEEAIQVERERWTTEVKSLRAEILKLHQLTDKLLFPLGASR